MGVRDDVRIRIRSVPRRLPLLDRRLQQIVFDAARITAVAIMVGERDDGDEIGVRERVGFVDLDGVEFAGQRPRSCNVCILDPVTVGIVNIVQFVIVIRKAQTAAIRIRDLFKAIRASVAPLTVLS